MTLPTVIFISITTAFGTASIKIHSPALTNIGIQYQIPNSEISAKISQTSQESLLGTPVPCNGTAAPGLTGLRDLQKSYFPVSKWKHGVGTKNMHQHQP